VRIAFTACNGLERDLPGDARPGRNAHWCHLANEHASHPFQLLLQGGDQVYADGVWDVVPELARWITDGRPVDRILSATALSAVHDFYFDLYCWVWGQRDLVPLLASIPSLMMWDDHDIFDGWGSHGSKLQACPIFQAVWSVAREHFALFQLGVCPAPRPEELDDTRVTHFGWSYALGNTGVIAPDLRSERTQRRVMGEAGWNWFVQALAELSHCRHVLLISSVPVVNFDLSPLERLLALLPADWLMQDDLRDQWRSYVHRKEWRRLVSHLLDFSEQTRTRVTVLSGEIHLGAFGKVYRDETECLQLISSGIVHPSPPRRYARLLDLLSRGSSKVTPDTRLAMLPLPNLNIRYLAARNWLSLDCGPDGAIAAQWHGEGIDAELRLAVPSPNPLDGESSSNAFDQLN
jgi:phosphodiesterase/alkaline phosphatase D-like protein